MKYKGPKHQYRDEETLRQLILLRIRKHLKSYNPFNQVSMKTLLKGQLPVDFLETYGLVTTKWKSYKISSFF